jgi:hypothetical protein
MHIDTWVVILQVVLAIAAVSRGWGWQPVLWFFGLFVLTFILIGVAPILLVIFGFSTTDLIFIGVMAYMIFNPRNR